MTTRLVLSLRDDVVVDDREPDRTVLRSDAGAVTIPTRDRPIAAALRALRDGDRTESELAVLDQADPGAAAVVAYVLQALDRGGFVVRTLEGDGAPLASLVPAASQSRYRHSPIDADARYVISRFAYLRAESGQATLSSPRAAARVVVHDSAAACAVHGLTTPQDIATLAAVVGLPAEAVATLVALLVGCDMASPVDERGRSAEDSVESLRTWEFHDLLFHARSRKGRHDQPIGATWRFVGVDEPPPALVPLPPGDVVALAEPSLVARRIEDDPLSRLQDERRSIRTYGPAPIDVDALGEFLFRVGRVLRREEREIETERGVVTVETAPQPYPGGGGMYELGLYPVVERCGGLERGLYRYDGVGHTLRRLPAEPALTDRLIGDAAGATGTDPGDAQVLIVISARFARMAWKYSSIAYAGTLKHVGVVYQTMYLVATAMGLGPCAVGTGDSDVFARAAGTDYFAETSVGEFMLGSADGGGGETRGGAQ